MTTMLSKFTGRCQRCKRRFGAGTLIEWSPKIGAVHAAPCDTRPDLPQATKPRRGKVTVGSSLHPDVLNGGA
jgi:hypothetical protein